MKSYKRVVNERYDKQKYTGEGIVKDIYSPVNPIGFYGEYKAAQILFEFVNLINQNRRKLDAIKICDCGCGDGIKTRFLTELLENPDQVYGVEFSRNRLQHCKSMNQALHYEYGDLTEPGGGIPFNVQFDGITAFVVFMHFTTEKEILSALKNVYNSLNRNGLFLWYELNARSHWDGKRKNVDHWGFSIKEMDRYALKAGFKLVRQSSIYSIIPFINKPTVYLVKSMKSILLLELLERLPFKKNNVIRIYRKE